MKITALDLNCDMGESFGCYKLGFDEEVIKFISSANIACGFHAGDPHVMKNTVAVAKECNVAIGAHPGLPDLLGFGRRDLGVSPEELEDFFLYQIGALLGITKALGLTLQHVKMHGALLNMSLKNEELIVAMLKAVQKIDPGLIWLTLTGLRTASIAKEMGLKTAREFYADRAYNKDKSLVSRKRKGAVINDPFAIKERIIKAVETGTVESIDGDILTVEFESICVHGDTPGALEIVKFIRKTLKEAGVQILPLAELI